MQKNNSRTSGVSSQGFVQKCQCLLRNIDKVPVGQGGGVGVVKHNADKITCLPVIAHRIAPDSLEALIFLFPILALRSVIFVIAYSWIEWYPCHLWEQCRMCE